MFSWKTLETNKVITTAMFCTIQNNAETGSRFSLVVTSPIKAYVVGLMIAELKANRSIPKTKSIFIVRKNKPKIINE